MKAGDGFIIKVQALGGNKDHNVGDNQVTVGYNQVTVGDNQVTIFLFVSLHFLMSGKYRIHVNKTSFFSKS